MMYDITFESGCRTHADCRNNGIDENESDGPDATSSIEGNDMGAFCHQGGACICSSATYFGDGCTMDGRDTHAAPKKYVSGNLRNLECDKSDLTPSTPIRATATVSRTSPRKVVLTQTAEAYETAENTLSAVRALALTADLIVDDRFIGMDVVETAVNVNSLGLASRITDTTASDFTYVLDTSLGKTASGGTAPAQDLLFGNTGTAADKIKITNAANSLKVGDKIRIENQVRSVVYVSPMCVTTKEDATKLVCRALTGTHYVEVDEPFVEDEFSSHGNIFDALTMVERMESDSSEGAGTGDDLASCVVTDMRALTSTTETCVEADGHACASAGVGGADPHEKRIVTLRSSGSVMDPREVDIGDRIRMVTSSIAGTGAATAAGTAPVWETRTIDSVTYSATGQVASFSVATAYGAALADSASIALYNDGKGTSEMSTCSGRGLCDESTGECACFAGYTDVDCSVQNALSI
jgi:hypothetical protein